MLAAKSASPLICGLSKPVSRSSRSCSITAAMWAMPPVVERMKPSDPVEVEGIHNVSVTLLQILSGGEAQALFGSPSTPGGLVPHPGRPLVTLPMSLDLTDVIDCTDSVTATRLETNAQELTGDWRAFGNRPVPSVHAGRAPTQSLGQALFETGEVKALLSFSARLPDYKILGLFTQ